MAQPGDGILQTGQRAANVAGLRALKFEELGDRALKNRLAKAGALYLLDGRLESLEEDVGFVVLQAVTSPLRDEAQVVLPRSAQQSINGRTRRYISMALSVLLRMSQRSKMRGFRAIL